MIRMLALAAACAVPLAGCSDQSSEPAEQASPDVELVSPVASPGATVGAATPAPAPSATEGIGQELPAAMRGRFGLVPADCTSTRGDNKGLVTIGAKQMQFYESVAVLKAAKPNSGAQLRGTFAYSGEGMEWSRDVALESRDGGKTLIMEEFGDDAPPGPRTYTRCG